MKADIPLALGTAQIGMDYGIANRAGRPAPAQAVEIIETAWKEGVRFFDTAQAYGDSERILGHCFKEIRKSEPDFSACVMTKLRPDLDPTEIETVCGEIKASLECLGMDRLWGFMLHRESWLDKGAGSLSRAIGELRHRNKFKHFGVSVYSPEYARKALEIDGIDFVQLPYNVFDQRASKQGVFTLAERQKKRVFVRSVYLQGLLLMNPDELPGIMAFAKDRVKAFSDYAFSCGLSAKLLSLAFAIQTAPHAMIVIGSETSDQIRENLALFHQAKDISIPDLKSFASNEPRMINPSLWK
ncbi:MAG: aldo/keto reductase [Deltaproteobacteria bacterium]|nr:aldo/keto reductase [Deltaproteobacteria bacterium]